MGGASVVRRSGVDVALGREGGLRGREVGGFVAHVLGELGHRLQLLLASHAAEERPEDEQPAALRTEPLARIERTLSLRPLDEDT